MSTEFLSQENYSLPEVEYKAEELQKRLRYSMANFARDRFIRAIKTRMLLNEST